MILHNHIVGAGAYDGPPERGTKQRGVEGAAPYRAPSLFTFSILRGTL